MEIKRDRYLKKIISFMWDGQVKEPHYYLFVKSGYTNDVQKQAAVDGAKLLIIDDLFSIEQ